jgi:hypothetical protein
MKYLDRHVYQTQWDEQGYTYFNYVSYRGSEFYHIAIATDDPHFGRPDTPEEVDSFTEDDAGTYTEKMSPCNYEPHFVKDLGHVGDVYPYLRTTHPEYFI